MGSHRCFFHDVSGLGDQLSPASLRNRLEVALCDSPAWCLEDHVTAPPHLFGKGPSVKNEESNRAWSPFLGLEAVMESHNGH